MSTHTSFRVYCIPKNTDFIEKTNIKGQYLGFKKVHLNRKD